MKIEVDKGGTSKDKDQRLKEVLKENLWQDEPRRENPFHRVGSRKEDAPDDDRRVITTGVP